MKNKFKKKTFIFWLLLVIVVGLLFLIKRDLFNLGFLNVFLAEYKLLAVIIYIFILALTGLFLTPSTPFTIASLLFFSPFEAFVYNLIGIVFSLTIAYYFLQFLGFDKFLKNKYPKKIPYIKERLKKKEFPIIVVWSFTPFFPTDLIIYASSSLRISYIKCLFGVLIGEGALNAIYLFSLGALFVL